MLKFDTDIGLVTFSLDNENFVIQVDHNGEDPVGLKTYDVNELEDFYKVLFPGQLPFFSVLVSDIMINKNTGKSLKDILYWLKVDITKTITIEETYLHTEFVTIYPNTLEQKFTKKTFNLPSNIDLIRNMDAYMECERCGEDSEHICLEKLPPIAFYEIYAAKVSDHPQSELNYCGGHPMSNGDEKWPCCPKHGPLMFLWQMTDQKRTKEKTVIQYFMCACIYEDQVSWNGQCLKDEKYKYNVTIDGISYDVESNKRFAYVTRQFYPTSAYDDKSSSLFGKLINPKSELILPKRYLHWEQIEVPYYRDILSTKFPSSEEDTKKYNSYLYFGRDEYGRKLLMDCDSMMQSYNDETELNDYTLFHHTMCFPEQSECSLDKGYIFMKQETGEFNLSIHCNPAGGIGITIDLKAHFIL